MKKYFKLLLMVVALLTFVSCSALHTTISKRNLEVQTKMSDTIWLNPASPSQKTLFVQVRNTSGKNLVVEEKIITNLQNKGYIIVADPNKANYWLQANILKVDAVDLRQGEVDSFSSGILAGGVGAVFGAHRSGGTTTALGWGLAAATVGTIADALVKDQYYAMVTDILVSEKTNKKVKITTKNTVKQGSSGKTTSTTSATSNTDQYSTRVLSTANKVNLKFEEAVPVLEEELAKAISGIF